MPVMISLPFELYIRFSMATNSSLMYGFNFSTALASLSMTLTAKSFKFICIFSIKNFAENKLIGNLEPQR